MLSSFGDFSKSWKIYLFILFENKGFWKPQIWLNFVATTGDKTESYFIRIIVNGPFSWWLEILKVKTGPSTPCVALPFFLENVCFLGCAQFSERGPPASKQYVTRSSEAPAAARRTGQSTNDYALVKMTCGEFLSRPLASQIYKACAWARQAGNSVVARLPGNRTEALSPVRRRRPPPPLRKFSDASDSHKETRKNGRLFRIWFFVLYESHKVLF